ncbi:MAG: hypothetical protein JWR19_723 [Pedosphaera sp.]|nr:hypothetical protein [Pedosphaera sp.]
MKQQIHISLGAMVAGLCLFCGGAVWGEGAGAEPKTVSLADVPAAVQRTIQAQSKGGKLGEIERDEKEGEVTYSVGLTQDGKERDFAVAENGRLSSVEVSLDETPEPVQKAIKTAVGGGILDNIDKVLEEAGTNSFEVDMTTKSGEDRVFNVGIDGKLLRFQMALEELPPAVRKTIESQAGKPGDIFRSYEGGEMSYEVKLNQNGKERELSVGPGGNLESMQVFPAELPPVGQATLKEKVGAGKLIQIYKAFGENRAFMYHVESRKEGKAFDFLIGPGGRFRGLDQ